MLAIIQFSGLVRFLTALFSIFLNSSDQLGLGWDLCSTSTIYVSCLCKFLKSFWARLVAQIIWKHSAVFSFSSLFQKTESSFSFRMNYLITSNEINLHSFMGKISYISAQNVYLTLLQLHPSYMRNILSWLDVCQYLIFHSSQSLKRIKFFMHSRVWILL